MHWDDKQKSGGCFSQVVLDDIEIVGKVIHSLLLQGRSFSRACYWGIRGWLISVNYSLWDASLALRSGHSQC